MLYLDGTGVENLRKPCDSINVRICYVILHMNVLHVLSVMELAQSAGIVLTHSS